MWVALALSVQAGCSPTTRGEGEPGDTEDGLVESSQALHYAERAGDDALAQMLESALAARRRTPSQADITRVEACLTEMLRRGGERWKTVLSESLKRIEPSASDDNYIHNLEILTALRRLEGKPDPVEVEAAILKPEEATFPELPTAAVTLRCREPVVLTLSGDYRSGRWERWRFEARDEAGQERPVILFFGDGILGGMYSRGLMKPGETWQTHLLMSSYLEPLEPGGYSLRILYSDVDAIASAADLRGRILCRSDPIPLLIRPRQVELNPDEQKDARAQIRILEAERPVKVWVGRLRPEMHDLIGAESPGGKLLAMRWKAVPPLIEALTDPTSSLHTRAWALALLFSLTGLADPRNELGVLGPYESREIRSWGLMSSTGGGFGFSPMPKSRSGTSKLSAEAQKPFVERWKNWSRFFQVLQK